MFQKLAKLESDFLTMIKRYRCKKNGHCDRCKMEEFHFCCICDSEISKDVPGYISHIDKRKKERATENGSEKTKNMVATGC